MPPSPADPDAPDQLGLAAQAMLFGVLFGTAVIAAVSWGVRTLQAGRPVPATPDPASGVALLILAGELGGAFAGGAAAWLLMAPIDSIYRRGGLTMVTAFATLVVSLIGIPVDIWLGRSGLLALSGFCALGCLWLSRRLRRRAGA